MARSPRLTTRKVKLKEACRALGCCTKTFARKWRDVFTDVREPEDRRERCARMVFEDELSVAVEEGRAAVRTFRRTVGRI